jgi:hypothetical protein
MTPTDTGTMMPLASGEESISSLQRTRRPSLRSLGSPLNARSLGAPHARGGSFLAAALFFFPSPSSHQLAGVVTDIWNTPLPGVTITLENPDRSSKRLLITDSAGRYSVTGLPPGNYRARFALDWFDPRAVDVVLNSASPRQLDIVLALADREEPMICLCEPPPRIIGVTEPERWRRYYVKVVDPSGNPVPNVAVQFNDRINSATVMTDLGGEACFPSPEPQLPSFRIRDDDSLLVDKDFCCIGGEHATATLRPRR